MRRKVRISCKCARKVRIWGLRADLGRGGGKKIDALFRAASNGGFGSLRIKGTSRILSEAIATSMLSTYPRHQVWSGMVKLSDEVPKVIDQVPKMTDQVPNRD